MRPRFLNIVGILLGLVALAIIAAVATVSVTLPGCAGCHDKRASFAKATQATAHAKAGTTCADCHVRSSDITARTRFAVYEIFGMWAGLLDPAATDATLASDAQCLHCHAKVMEDTTRARGLAIKHASCTAGSRCTDCHSEVGHGSATPWPRGLAMNDCTSCHKERSATLACDSCHLGKVDRTAAADPEFSFTHGANWRDTHGMGQMNSCSTCHQADSCVKCHGPGVPHGADFMSEHAALSQQPGATCLACHNQSFCFSCHLTEMPHTHEFVTTHSTIVRRDGDTSCLRCHVEADCDNCHIKHVHPGGAVGNIPSPKLGGK